MSHRTYERHWREAEGELARVLHDDRDYVAQDLIEDRPKAFKQAATNYIRYKRVILDQQCVYFLFTHFLNY